MVDSSTLTFLLTCTCLILLCNGKVANDLSGNGCDEQLLSVCDYDWNVMNNHFLCLMLQDIQVSPFGHYL